MALSWPRRRAPQSKDSHRPASASAKQLSTVGHKDSRGKESAGKGRWAEGPKTRVREYKSDAQKQATKGVQADRCIDEESEDGPVVVSSSFSDIAFQCFPIPQLYFNDCLLH